MKTSSTRSVWSAFAALVLLSGCDAATQTAIRQVQQAAQQAQQNSATSATTSSSAPSSSTAIAANATLPPLTSDEKIAIKDLQNQATQWVKAGQKSSIKPFAGGKGIVVTEPVLAAGTDARWRDFATGCTRWIHLQSGGAGELSLSPLWGLVTDMQRDLKLPSLRLDTPNAAQLARACGATHAATSSVKANGERATLQLRVLDVRTQRATGAPVVLSGTRAQIVASLPRAVREINARLGVSPLRKVIAPTVSGDEMAFLGQLPRKRYDGNLTRPQEARLRAINAHEPLAGMLWIYNGARHTDESRFWRQVARDMMKRDKENILIRATLAWKAIYHYKPYASGLAPLARRYPRNLLVALAEGRWNSFGDRDDAQMQSAMRAVRIAPRSDVAWLEVAKAFSEKAQSIRHSRYSNELSDKEQQQIGQLYPNALMASAYATKLGPNHAGNWLEACESATFDGNDASHALFWQALRLDPDDTDIQKWGLQIFQPKWGGSQNEMRQLIAFVQTRPKSYPWILRKIESAMEFSNLKAEAPAVRKNAIADMEKMSKAEPNNPRYHECLAYLYDGAKQYSKSLQHYVKWMRLQSDNMIPMTNLANMYGQEMSDQTNAEKWYLKALAIDPLNADLSTKLGNFYKNVRRDFDKAAPRYRRAMQLDSSYVEPVTGLANIYWFLKNDEKNGGRLFLQAISLSSDGAAHSEYAWALMRHGKRDAALKIAKIAQQRGEREHPVFEALGLK